MKYAQHRYDGSFWPNPAVRLSIAGCQAGKLTDCHDRQQPTQSGLWRWSNECSRLAQVNGQSDHQTCSRTAMIVCPTTLSGCTLLFSIGRQVLHTCPYLRARHEHRRCAMRIPTYLVQIEMKGNAVRGRREGGCIPFIQPAPVRFRHRFRT